MFADAILVQAANTDCSQIKAGVTVKSINLCNLTSLEKFDNLHEMPAIEQQGGDQLPLVHVWFSID